MKLIGGLVLCCLQCLLFDIVNGFWDEGMTSTHEYIRSDVTPRQSFFRWQMIQWDYMRFWAPQWDWPDIERRRFLNCVAGISIDLLPLGTAIILNRRVLLTSANYLEPYGLRMKELRIWALGRAGTHLTPYRYRVWRFRRIFPRSNNPEHWHGPRGRHVPRHDIAIIQSWDQIFLYHKYPDRYHYAFKGFLAPKKMTLSEELYYVGSGYEYLDHIKENYKIFYGLEKRDHVVNCEKYLPKWWGKFICVINSKNVAGVPNGGGMFTNGLMVGIGCFEIRYNEDRIMVFTDIRYYWNWIYIMGNLTPSEYYEYAYPQWSVKLGLVYDGTDQVPYIPHWQKRNDLYPYGK